MFGNCNEACNYSVKITILANQESDGNSWNAGLDLSGLCEDEDMGKKENKAESRLKEHLQNLY